MALHYDIAKVKILQEKKPEHIATLLSSLSVYLNDLKIFVNEKNHKKTSEIIKKAILITDTLGIDSAHDEALQIKLWAENEGKRKEISITLKEMISHCKNAVKEIKKDFLVQS